MMVISNRPAGFAGIAGAALLLGSLVNSGFADDCTDCVSEPAACAPAVESDCAPVCDTEEGCTDAGCNGGCNGDSLDLLSLLDTPLLSSLRNVPLGDCWTLSVGGEIRYRYMDESDRLRPGGPGDSTYDLWRITPFMELKSGDDLTLYAQAIDASIFNHELPVTGIDQNRLDMLQYYVDAKIGETCDGGTLRARVGRQFLKYGSQHLISPLGWSITYRNFEGIKLYYSDKDWNIDGFWTRPVNAAAGGNFRPVNADHPDQSKSFAGIYSTYKGLDNAVLDLYWLYLNERVDKDARLDGRRHTIGARYDGKQAIKDACGTVVGTWNYEVEGAYQFGTNETFQGDVDEDISAGMVHGQLGYTFNDVAWTPSIKGLFYWGSGDDNPGDGENGNFNTLSPLGHAYWGIIDNLNGSNLLDYSIQASVKPSKKLTVMSQLHWFEKDQAISPIFNVAGAPFGTGNMNTSATDIGTELDIVATYAVSKTLTVQAGYSWFWYGNAVQHDTIARDDAEQFYLMTSWSF